MRRPVLSSKPLPPEAEPFKFAPEPPDGRYRFHHRPICQRQLASQLTGKDQEVLAATPWFANVLEIFNAVARPSTVTGTDYDQLSRAIFQNVNKVLSGGESARDAVAQIEQTAQSMRR